MNTRFRTFRVGECYFWRWLLVGGLFCSAFLNQARADTYVWFGAPGNQYTEGNWVDADTDQPYEGPPPSGSGTLYNDGADVLFSGNTAEFALVYFGDVTFDLSGGGDTLTQVLQVGYVTNLGTPAYLTIQGGGTLTSGESPGPYLSDIGTTEAGYGDGQRHHLD